jgi:hypothetical protein
MCTALGADKNKESSTVYDDIYDNEVEEKINKKIGQNWSKTIACIT